MRSYQLPLRESVRPAEELVGKARPTLMAAYIIQGILRAHTCRPIQSDFIGEGVQVNESGAHRFKVAFLPLDRDNARYHLPSISDFDCLARLNFAEGFTYVLFKLADSYTFHNDAPRDNVVT